MPAFRDPKPTSSKKQKANKEQSNQITNTGSARYHPFFKQFFGDKEGKGITSKNRAAKARRKELEEEEHEDNHDHDHDDLDIDIDIEQDEEEEDMTSANSSIQPHGTTVVQPNSLPIPRFFSGGKDPLGRTLDQILSWDDERLERQHNFIQCIFPLPEHSYFAGPDTPVLDESSVAIFHASAEHRAALFRAFERMMSFYGFDIKVKSSDVRNPMKDADREVTVTTNEEFEEKVFDWLGGHNNMRITRIIRSLRLLGLEPEAAAFYKALEDFRKEALKPDANPMLQRRIRVGDSFVYWTRAAKRPLFIPPDANDAEAERMIMARAQAKARVRATLVDEDDD